MWLVGRGRDVGDHQPRYTGRMQQGGSHSDLAPHGMTQQGHRPRHKPVQRVNHIRRHRRVLHPVRMGTCAVVTQIEGQNAALCGKPPLDHAKITSRAK